MKENNTPLTDKEVLKHVWKISDFGVESENVYEEIIYVTPYGKEPVVGVVSAKFARNLEEELNELKKWKSDEQSFLIKLGVRLCLSGTKQEDMILAVEDLIKERDELKKTIENYKKEKL